MFYPCHTLKAYNFITFFEKKKRSFNLYLVLSCDFCVSYWGQDERELEMSFWQQNSSMWSISRQQTKNKLLLWTGVARAQTSRVSWACDSVCVLSNAWVPESLATGTGYFQHHKMMNLVKSTLWLLPWLPPLFDWWFISVATVIVLSG